MPTFIPSTARIPSTLDPEVMAKAKKKTAKAAATSDRVDLCLRARQYLRYRHYLTSANPKSLKGPNAVNAKHITTADCEVAEQIAGCGSALEMTGEGEDEERWPINWSEKDKSFPVFIAGWWRRKLDEWQLSESNVIAPASIPTNSPRIG